MGSDRTECRNARKMSIAVETKSGKHLWPKSVQKLVENAAGDGEQRADGEHRRDEDGAVQLK